MNRYEFCEGIYDVFYLKESENVQSPALHKMQQYPQSCTEKGIDRFSTERVNSILCKLHSVLSLFFQIYGSISSIQKKGSKKRVVYLFKWKKRFKYSNFTDTGLILWQR